MLSLTVIFVPKANASISVGFDNQKDYLQVNIGLIEPREQSAESAWLSESVPKILMVEEHSGSGLQIYYCGSTGSG